MATLQFTITEKAMRFVLETITDLAFVPGLVRVGERGRHFELFIGVMHLMSSFFYNLCNALNIAIFLTEGRWHQLNNIFALSYGMHLLIFLMGNRNENRDHVLRYAAFAAIWICQIKDGYWMTTSQYTLIVVAVFAALLVLSWFSRRGLSLYSRPKILRGVLWGAAAGATFYVGLDDWNDPFRLWHGLSQIFAGVCIQYLWQAVPSNLYKKSDVLSSHVLPT